MAGNNTVSPPYPPFDPMNVYKEQAAQSNAAAQSNLQNMIGAGTLSGAIGASGVSASKVIGSTATLQHPRTPDFLIERAEGGYLVALLPDYGAPINYVPQLTMEGVADYIISQLAVARLQD